MSRVLSSRGFFSSFWFSFNLSLLICHPLFNPYLGWGGGGVIKVDDKDLSSLYMYSWVHVELL